MLRVLASITFFALVCRAQGSEGKVPHFELVGDGTNELGKIVRYEKKTARFRLKNAGNAPGAIRSIIPTCSCVSGTSDKTWVQPREETEIQATLDPFNVHGVFERVLWVETNDPACPRIPLSLRGEVIPLFQGLPESPQQVVLPEGAFWTNRFTLTGVETNLFLGTPTLDTDTNKLRATVSVATNTHGKTSSDVTLVIATLASGYHSLYLSLPAEGRPDLPPVKLTFHVHVGLELKVAPSRIPLTPTGQPLTRRLHIMTPDKILSTNSLTWTSSTEGVSVLMQPSPKGSFLMATLTLSPQAVTNLLQEKDAQMTFHYPNYKSARVSFFSQPAPLADTSKPPKASQP